MTYFVVKEGAIQEAFESLEEATARAQDAGARVIGDEWVTLTSAKDRVQKALLAVDEVAALLDPQEVAQMRERLGSLETMIDAALERLGLRG
jgi:hypothetical protein